MLMGNGRMGAYEMKLGKGCCHGTFGELVQGRMGDHYFLITLPIPSLRSEASFIPEPAVSGLRVTDCKLKAKRAGEWLLQLFGVNGGGDLEIHSNIPVGKGLASSSADIVAAIRAIADGYSLPLSNELISMIAAKVEPTDGVMYDEIVAYDYIHGQLIESLGTLPPFIIVGIDLGGTVNTIEFNKAQKAYSRHDLKQFLKAYDYVKKGFKEKNLAYICQAATMSARINQKILPKPIFHLLENLAQLYQGGIVVAHSGTVAGILLNRKIPNRHEVVLHLSREMLLFSKGLNTNLFLYDSEERILV
jgi:L-threonine kinase